MSWPWPKTIVLNVESDVDCECPSDEDGSIGGWKLVSFMTREHAGAVKPADVGVRHQRGDSPKCSRELAFKLKHGLAFWLDCYIHSGTVWSLAGTGMNCQWDTTRYAGYVEWPGEIDNLGAVTVEDRAQDARNFLEEYNAWANGYTLRFTIRTAPYSEDEEAYDTAAAEELDYGGGFVDGAAIAKEVTPMLKGHRVILDCPLGVVSESDFAGVTFVEQAPRPRKRKALP